MQKRYFYLTSIITILVIAIAVTLHVYTKQNESIVSPTQENELIYNDDGTVTIGEGMTSFGFRDSETNTIIDFGNSIETKEDKLIGRINFHQNISKKINYLLIILLDFLQVEFKVDQNIYTSYAFSLEGNEEININIELDLINCNAHEFEYIIVREPELMSFTKDNSILWDNIGFTDSIVSSRFLINGSTDAWTPQVYENKYTVFDSDVSYPPAIVRNYQDAKVLPYCYSNEKLDLVFTNIYPEETDYVFIAFSNWKQVEFTNGQKQNAIRIPGESNIVYSLTMPEVQSQEPYQIFCFSLPLNIYQYHSRGSASLRTVIIPNENN